MRFVGDGEEGLFGYVKFLTNSSPASIAAETPPSDSTASQGCSCGNCGTCSTCTLRQQLAQLKMDLLEREASAQALKRDHEALQDDIKKVNEELKVLRSYKTRTFSKLTTARRALKKSERSLKRADELLDQHHVPRRKRKAADELAPGGRALRQRLNSVRQVLFPTEFNADRENNKNLGSRKRLAKDKTLRARMGSLMGRALTIREMREALKGAKFDTLKKQLTQEYLTALKEKLTPWMVQRALDVGGGTNKCWQELFKTMGAAFEEIGLNINTAIPNPHQQRQFCKLMNENFQGLGAFKVEEGENAEEGDDAEEGGDAEKIMDNIQMDVTRLLQTLVNFYNLRENEVDGVLK
eukprot:7682183-Pyramimonas_sp.AAC.1